MAIRESARAPGSPSTAATARSELHVERERVRESAEIDLRAGETLIRRQIAGPALKPDFPADVERVADRHADAAEDQRPDVAAAARERAVDDRGAVAGDEVA